MKDLFTNSYKTNDLKHGFVYMCQVFNLDRKLIVNINLYINTVNFNYLGTRLSDLWINCGRL